MACLQAMKADRSLQFEFKLLTKFLLRIQPDCQTSAQATHDLSKVDYMPASKAVRLRFETPKPNFSRYGSVRLQPEIFNYCRNYSITACRGKSERTSSERGLSGLQSEKTLYCRSSCTASCCQPYPNYFAITNGAIVLAPSITLAD
jgi:hypothetical protein